jgi:hypothetical protein
MKFNEAKLRQIIEEEIQAELDEVREQQLDEGISDIFGQIWDALTGIPTGVIQNIKEWMAGKVLGLMGVDSDSIFSKVLINMFGNLSTDDLANIMSGDQKCLTATSELAGGATETLVEYIPEMLGIDSSGWLAGAVRESLGESFLKGINLAIGKAVCEMDFGSLFGKTNENMDTQSEEDIRERIQEKLTQISMLHEEKKKNWMKDIKSTGECSPYTKPGCEGRAKAFAKRAQSGDVHDDNLKKGKNPHGPG